MQFEVAASLLRGKVYVVKVVEKRALYISKVVENRAFYVSSESSSLVFDK